MKYAELKNTNRFGTLADLIGGYKRGRLGCEISAGFSDFEMKEATPEIEEIIRAFRGKYRFVETCTRYTHTDDNDEIGTGSAWTYQKYTEIDDECVFLIFENKVLGVAYPVRGKLPVAWFNEEYPGEHYPYCDYSFSLKD